MAKMQMERIYHGESCKGAVSLDIYVDAKNGVIGRRFDDGDISSSQSEWALKKDENGYFIHYRDDTDTLLGRAVPDDNNIRLNASSDLEARGQLIDYLMKIYNHVRQNHVRPKEIREGLVKALLS